MSAGARLEAGLAALGLALPEEATGRLLDYLALLEKWGRVYSLTAVREPEAAVTLHLLDSLALLPHCGGPRVADVGSGAGLPGIPLALARPDWQFALVEANQKKAAFLTQAVIELRLGNVEVVAQRAEAWRPQRDFDAVLSRAFAALAEFVRVAGHLCAPPGRLIAMKGARPEAELARLPAGWELDGLVALAVPGLDAARHLVIMKRA